MGPLSIRSGRQAGVKHPKMKPGGMSDLTIPEQDPVPADCQCRTARECYCYDNGHTGDTICVACGEEIK